MTKFLEHLTYSLQWRFGNPARHHHLFQESEVSIKGIGSFHQAKINGNNSFPYLDIQISWNDKRRPHFNVYKKLGELVKYLNHDSHHHRSHKTAVLSGVELPLALLTTKTAYNLTKSMLDIYPDKNALTIAGQLKPCQKMHTLGDILDNK